MSLHDAIAAALPELRAEAESLMTDDFELRNYGEGWFYNTDEDREERIHEVLFTSRGKIVSRTQVSASQVGERTALSVERILHLPVSTPAVPVGTVARRLRDGAEFEVLGETTHQQPKSRRFPVSEVLS